jgi:hypothetical protein
MALCFIPQPKQLTLARGTLALPSRGVIAIADHTWGDPALEVMTIFSGLTLVVDVPGIPSDVTVGPGRGLKKGGYRLTIDPREGVRIEADSPAAAVHAAQTLAQVAHQSPRDRLPALAIEDWPDFADRGVYLDLTRGRVPTLESLLEQVDQLSRYKINQFQIYLEHTFKFRRHPAIGKGASPLEAQDILVLDAFCRERGVELVPSLATFGHMANILKHPEYHELAEDWGIGKYVDQEGLAKLHPHMRHRAWGVSPANPKTYDFLDSLFAELLPLFSSEKFNICCDETWDLGFGQTHDLIKKKGMGPVYLGHIVRLADLARKRGKRVQFWGDIIRKYPELIPKIPKDVTVLDWGYDANHNFDSIGDFAKVGLPFYACPGTSSWVSLFPRLHEAAANIHGFAAAAHKHGAQGLLNTDWGDGGHYNFMEFSWHGYLFGAEQAWNVTADTKDFTRRFCCLFLGESSAELAKAVTDLGDVTHTRHPFYYQSIWQSIFFAGVKNKIFALEPAECWVAKNGKIEKKKIAIDAKFAEAALDTLTRVRATLVATAKHRDADPLRVLPYWIFAIDTMSHAAKKLAVLGSGGEDTSAHRRTLAREMKSLRKRFEELWMASSRKSEIVLTLKRYDGAIKSLERE